VIAEGVETTATLQRLRELQCDQGQGTLISPALRAVDVPLIGSALGLAA
jgi:EAL domain-containing protein (putative c-di-GMP-specific phosphodiesterase class I)